MATLTNKERIVSLDVLRGIALIGIFVVNISLMKSLSLLEYSLGLPSELTGIDRWLSLVIQLFAEGSFISIFSFLFGVGFFIFMSNAEAKGFKVKRLFARRLTGLLVIGAIHFTLIWMGDILLTYALTGFLLLLFYNRKTKTILVSAFLLLSLFFLLIGSQLLMPESMVADLQDDSHAMLGQAEAAYGTAPSWEWITYRLTEEVPFIGSQLVFLASYVLGMFLLGFYAGRKGWFQKGEQLLPFFRKLRNTCLTISLPLLAALALVYLGVTDTGVKTVYVIDLLTRVSAVFLAFAYLSMIVIWVHKPYGKRLKARLAAMGRMALTNYLMQTTLALTFIYGFGLFNNMQLWQGILLCATIIAIQMAVSPLWLNRFRYGPMEKIWRAMTYGRTKPLEQGTQKAHIS
ncbi:DUF418 domain-containing protein [Salipaludibacillus aurantiacus]|uniref:DUF418 domain-containing protein n=1 Tax=Salipaludibacillus aurantiacus TaxID=1601833 RepID=A0A1H9TY08_9BACI|nr:DUF418 domain-containing protein [Salipaludibacillus aurantiacus]SES01901.1 uncharacterized protein SAMN05518684_106155 [Salipaludibacillus aurantiacus]